MTEGSGAFRPSRIQNSLAEQRLPGRTKSAGRIVAAPTNCDAFRASDPQLIGGN